VERPLRLRWEITHETLAAARAVKALAKLHPDVVDGLAESLTKHAGLSSSDRAEFVVVVGPLVTGAGPSL